MSRPTRGPQENLPIRGCHPLRPAFPDGSGNSQTATGLIRFRSPLLAESRLMSFPPATEMFQFAGFASRTYEFSPGSPLQVGLPHSEIPGSTIARISPGLFAACHVLHRLSVPRHPPDALKTLDSTAPCGAAAKPATHRGKARRKQRFPREDTLPHKAEDTGRKDRRQMPPSLVPRPPPRSHSLFTLSKNPPAFAGQMQAIRVSPIDLPSSKPPPGSQSFEPPPRPLSR